jgi:hypothetical protein
MHLNRFKNIYSFWNNLSINKIKILNSLKIYLCNYLKNKQNEIILSKNLKFILYLSFVKFILIIILKYIYYKLYFHKIIY